MEKKFMHKTCLGSNIWGKENEKIIKKNMLNETVNRT